MRHLEISREAEAELEEIWNYIAGDNVAAANRMQAKFEQAFQKLIENPGLGHRRSDLTTRAVLFWSVGQYLVIYQSSITAVRVLAILHAARDIADML